MQIHNTLNRKKEKLEGKDLRIYTCGPTVYNFAHIGNLRTYVFEDLLKRTLLFLGFSVKHVMNITDIDDKTIKNALEKKVSLKEYTEPFTEAFFEDLNSLNILEADHYPRATDYISVMIQMIQDLMEKKVAYVGQDKSVYFSISKYKEYGKLSHLKLDELKKGASERCHLDEYDKENASDFVLWKSYDSSRDGDIFWESPFGKGRPGWHIECSAMAIKLLGETIDIHCGGVDNIFPHHENEIAQSECCTGKTFAKYWMHSEHLIVDGKKMSKSLGNFYTLRDLLEKDYRAEEVRYMLLHTHYRTQLNFTLDGLKGARSSLGRIHDFQSRLKEIQGKGGKEDLKKEADLALSNFREALADDLNISLALSYLFDLIRAGNILADQNQISGDEAEYTLKVIKQMDSVLGVLSPKEDAVPEEILDALQKREVARKEKNWKESDRLRDFILSAGYIIDDMPSGARVKRK